MTLPVLNLAARIVDEAGKLIAPWNTFFQQFTQAPGAAIAITVTASPFVYKLKEPGQIALSGGAITTIKLSRGTNIIDVTGQKIFFAGLADVITVTYTILPTMKFLPQY